MECQADSSGGEMEVEAEVESVAATVAAEEDEARGPANGKTRSVVL